MRLLIEVLWTRLSNQFKAEFPSDDNLQMERIAPLLSTRLRRMGDRVGWDYRYDDLSAGDLDKAKPISWEPDPIEGPGWVILMQTSRRGELDIRDEELRAYAVKEGFDVEAAVADLVARRLLAWTSKNTVRVIASKIVTAFTPDGRVFASDEDVRLGPWTMQELSKHHRE